MADGQHFYSGNALLAAAGSPTCSVGGCPSCVKAGLPVLLVRPGLAERTYANRVSGAITPLLKSGAAPALSHSGYVMRTLRRGYVYAYYETPHTVDLRAQKGWEVQAVDEGGYLTPYRLETLPMVDSADRPTFSCQRSAGYAAAMLFVIPDAMNTGRVWVAYSEHPWSEKVRQQYADDPALRDRRMTCIDAPKASCERSVPLTQSNLQSLVLDYAPLPPAGVLEGNPHQALRPAGFQAASWDSFILREETRPAQRGENAANVMEQARQIIDKGGNQFRAASPMIAGVSDAVGVTAEAAQLRMTQCASATQWVSQQSGGDAAKADWMLKSALSIAGLLAIIDQQGESKKQQYAAAGYAQYHGQSMYVTEFEALKRSGALPPDASFTPQTTHDGMARTADMSKPGFVSVPDARRIDSDTRSLKDEVHDKLQANGAKHAHARFLDTFKAKTEDDARKLARVELDYKALFDSAARKLVTSHDFDEDYIFDGVFYLVCVCKLTHAGYLTDNGLEWYQKLLTDNPNDKENLLLRALLGNQKSAFAEWLAKGSGPYGRLKSIVSELEKLKPEDLSAEGRAMLRSLPYFKIVLAGYASPVVTVMGAVATGLSKRQQISAAFRQKLAVLAGLLGGQASGAAPPALLKLSLPMPDAARIWRQQVGAIQNAVRKFAGTVKGERVQSLVLEGAIALETRGAQQAGDILVDVYLWVDELPDAVGDALEGAKDVPDRISAGGAAVAARVNGYVLRPAAANLNQAWQGAARFVTRTQLDRLARNSVQLMSNGTALLAAGSGVFSSLALLDAWEKFEHGSAEEREKAAVSLLTAGLGLSAALLSVGAEIADQASKKALKESLKKRAGIIGAIATAIDAVKSVIQSFSEYSKENWGTAGFLLLQGLLLIGAAGAGVGVAIGVGSTTILGLSVTGWGLILVALGTIVGFIIAALQDTPVEHWAGQTFWGRYPDKWGSLKREQEELNKLLIGVRVDFDFRSRLTNWSNYGRAVKRGLNPIGNAIETVREVWNGEPVGPKVTREAWARVMLPEVLESSLPWAIRIVAKKKDKKEALVAYYSHHPGSMAFIVARRGRQLEHEIGNVEPEASEARKNGVWTIELSAQLDVNVYRDAWAEVVIYGDPAAEQTPLVEQTLRESRADVG